MGGHYATSSQEQEAVLKTMLVAHDGSTSRHRSTLTTLSVLQNGIHPKDTFNVVEELRRARAAHHGQKLVDEHSKEEAVLSAALHAHDDSARIDENPVEASCAVLYAAAMI